LQVFSELKQKKFYVTGESVSAVYTFLLKPVLMSLCSMEAFMFLVGLSVARRSNLGAEARLQILQTISIITLASWILTCKELGWEVVRAL